MNDDGDTKDDVKVPDGEVGEKIIKLFKTDEKDTSKPIIHRSLVRNANMTSKTSSFSRPWARRRLLRPRRLPSKDKRLAGNGPTGQGLVFP
jgi:hypothetical protein